jgi:hypothetical protein
MQPIGPYSPWTRTHLPDDHPDSPPLAARPTDPPEPPDLTDFDAEAYVIAARSMGVSPIAQNPALEALGAVHHARDAALQQRLDGFRAQATPTYRTPMGDVRVATPFWLGAYPVHPDKQEELRITCKALGLSQPPSAKSTQLRAATADGGLKGRRPWEASLVGISIARGLPFGSLVLGWQH